MSKSTYPLKLPNSVKNAAAQLAKADGVSLNQFIAAAVAEKVGTLQTAQIFLKERAGTAKPGDLLKYLKRAPKSAPAENDRTQADGCSRMGFAR
jgi:hypothetical protein